MKIKNLYFFFAFNNNGVCSDIEVISWICLIKFTIGGPFWFIILLSKSIYNSGNTISQHYIGRYLVNYYE